LGDSSYVFTNYGWAITINGEFSHPIKLLKWFLTNIDSAKILLGSSTNDYLKKYIHSKFLSQLNFFIAPP